MNATRVLLLIVLLGQYAICIAQVCEKTVLRYLNIGEIRYCLPIGFNHVVGVPSFTNGPRLMKQQGDEIFQLRVHQSVTRISEKDLRDIVVAVQSHSLFEAQETQIDVQKLGEDSPVYYATLTSKKQGRGKYLTRGIRAAGNVLFLFDHISDDQDGKLRDRFLSLVRTAELLNAQSLVTMAQPPVLVGTDAPVSAQEEARARLDEFFIAMEGRSPERSGFKVQVAARGDVRTGYVWIDLPSRVGPLFSGIVIGQPSFTSNIRDNQQLFFTRTDITDWGYRERGKLIGNFTLKARLSSMPKEEAEKIKAENGWD